MTQFKNIIFKFSEKIPNIDIELKKEILTNFRLVKTVRTLKILSKQNEKLLSRLELLFLNNYETISFGLKVLKSKNRSLFFTYLWLRNFLNTKNFI